MTRISLSLFLVLACFILLGLREHSIAKPLRSFDNKGEPGHYLYLPIMSSVNAVEKPVLKWSNGGCFASWCQTGWYASPAVYNVDGDPQLEVIAGSYDLIALDGVSGALEWRTPNNNRVWPGIALANMTGDGNPEIIVGRSGDQVSVYTLQGALFWTRNPFGAGEVRTLAISDLDNNGAFEVIVGRASGGATKQVNVFDAAGNVRPGFPARRDGEAGYGWGMYNQNIAVADLNGDGYKEIIAPTDTHYITALDKDGNQLPVHSMYGASKVWSQVGVHVSHAVDLRGYAICGTEHRPNFADSAPVISDLDGNGILEIIVIGNVYNCGTNPYTSLYQMPFIFRSDRTRWAASGFDWTAIPLPDALSAPLSEDYNLIETAVPNPAVADLDGDGFKEILFPSYDGRLHAFWLDKTEHGNFPFQVTHPSEGFIRFASEPVIADLNHDGKAEVIFASWVQKGTNRSGKLHLLDYQGKILFELDLPPARNGDWNGALAAPTLANVDIDADLELILQTAHSGVVVYDLPRTENAVILWGTGRGSYLRNGSK